VNTLKESKLNKYAEITYIDNDFTLNRRINTNQSSSNQQISMTNMIEQNNIREGLGIEFDTSSKYMDLA